MKKIQEIWEKTFTLSIKNKFSVKFFTNIESKKE